MRFGFVVRITLDGALCGILTVLYGSVVIPPLFKVNCEFSRNLFGSFAVGLLSSLADLLMQPLPSARRDTFVQHLVIERVQETVAPCQSSVRPVGCTLCPEELPAPH